MIIKMIMRLLYLAVVQQHGRQEWKEFLLPHMGSIQGAWDLTVVDGKVTYLFVTDLWYLTQ